MRAVSSTPKQKTLEMFGKARDGEPGKEPFHLYSMKQAIEEGFPKLRNTVTGAVYSNLNTKEGGASNLKDQDMIFERGYPGEKQGYLSPGEWSVINVPQGITVMTSPGTFSGLIAVQNSAYAINSVLADYYDYQQRQKVFYIYTVCGLLALLLSLYLYRTEPVAEALDVKAWRQL
ncbi:MAG: hypothetical protein CVU89_02950 [Firmicutes bacterium HGW-Firmicutes-14]|jgi:hypothetical protein|nr:MAG: hypothetical protein CVU89_02950 [Firmicutes bacterium HGW-Firmicutes-14]